MSTLTTEQLNEYMKKSWSWFGRGSSSNPNSTVLYITDSNTGVKYKLQVINGDLTMSEVTE